MNARERFKAVMNFERFDRLPVIELAAWWDKTIERWHKEGLPRHLNDRYDICRHFGLDIIYQYWMPIATSGLPVPAEYGTGVVSDIAGYREILPYIYPVDKTAFLDEALIRNWAGEQASGDAVIRFTFEGFFWVPRRLLGIERHIYAFYDQPELIHAINRDLLSFYFRALDAIEELCRPDLIVISEDMSYNNGPMLSKAHFEEFLMPYYSELLPDLKKRDIKVFIDSDGDITEAVPWFEAAGFDGMLPLERQAGVDLAFIRGKHPQMRFIGGFDKMTMNRGEEAMRREFERLLPVVTQGGYLISCDHQTPPDVSYSDYRLYLQLFREYSAKAGGTRY